MIGRPVLAAAILAALAAAGCQPLTGATTGSTTSTTSSVARQHVTGGIPAGCHARAGGQLPDPRCTPGAIDPRVTQATIGTTICRAGYTRRVRPLYGETRPVKPALLHAYGLTVPLSRYELDHLVPLELGGSSTTANLWPEPGASPNRKDRVEDRLHAEVCAGRLTLAAAQQEIARDWRAAR